MAKISESERRLQNVIWEADLALTDLRMRVGELREALEAADPDNEMLNMPVNTNSRVWKIHSLMQTLDNASDLPEEVKDAYDAVMQHYVVQKKRVLSDEHRKAISDAQKKRWGKE